MKEIYKNLYIGQADEIPKAKEKGFAVVSAFKDGPHGHRELLKYEGMSAPSGKEYLLAERPKHLYANLIDAHDESLIPDKILDAVLAFVTHHIGLGQKILIACNQAKSRAPSLGMLWLVENGKLPVSYSQALRQFQKLYPDYEPNDGIRLAVKNRIQNLRNRR
jgi:hypothetical protein